MSVARFVADQRTNYRVPHAKTCQWLGLSQSWFYKWLQRAGDPDGLHTDTDRRRAEVDAAVVERSRAARGLHGSPRLHADLREAGWVVSEKTVAESMRRQGLVARQDQTPQRVDPAGQDGAEVPRPGEARLHRRRPEPEVGGRHDRDPDRGREAVPGHGDRPVLPPAARRGDRAAPRRRAGLPGHPDGCRGPRRGRQHRRGDLPQRPRLDLHGARSSPRLCRKLGIRQSMGRVGSCFDNACAEAFFSSLEWEVLSRTTSRPLDKPRLS